MSNSKTMPAARIAIIGGTGMQRLPGLQARDSVTAVTDWGATSAPVQRGTVEGTEVLFLPRHGSEGVVPPHKVNYRANIAALAQLGARWVFAFNTVGGVAADFVPGTLVVPDQIVDYTWGREHSFWEDCSRAALHVDFTEPYDRDARQFLLAGALTAGVAVVPRGVYAATQGPRLESAAEIKRLQRDGCDLVGMTGMPEAALAREMNLAYAVLSLVVNAAAGLSPAVITTEGIDAVTKRELPRAVRILAAAACAVDRRITT